MLYRQILLALFAASALFVHGADIIFLGFDRTAKTRRTIAGYGRTERQDDRALVLAKSDAASFTAEAAPDAVIPTGDYPVKLNRFPAEGYLDLYAMPFFNGSEPYKLTTLSSGNDAVLTLAVDACGVTLTVNGKSVRATAGELHARHYIQIQAVWDGGQTRLYIERRLAATLDGSPADADRAVLHETFQGLVDEYRIGDGIPLTLDKNFDGDPEKFPEIPGSGEILTSPWRTNVPDALKIVPDARGIRFEWNNRCDGGKSYALAQNQVTYPVTGGKIIRGDYSWKKVRWQYASSMGMYLRFADKNGKTIRRMPIDARSDVPRYIFPMALSEFATEAGIGVPMSYFNYYCVPANAVAMSFEMGFSGNPVTVELSRVKFRYVDPERAPWFGHPRDVQRIHDYTRLSPPEVDAALAKRERAYPELKREGDRVELFINGKKTPAHIFVNPGAGNYRWINGFKRGVFPCHVSNVVLGRSSSFTETEQIWQEDGSIDISPLRKAVRKVVQYDPQAYIFIGLMITPPRSYLEANKAELMVNEKGEYAVMRDFAVRGLYSKKFPDKIAHTWYPSTASEKYRKDVAEVLKKALGEFEKTPESKAVIGFYVLGGDDGQFRFPPLPDFSAPAIRSYRAFLKAQGRKDADRAAMPDPLKFRKPPFPKFGDSEVSDYQKWSTQVSYELRRSMYTAVKNAMPRVLVGGYENAMGLTGQPGFGRYKIHELLTGKVPDFLISLPGYNRYRDDCDHPSGMKAYNGSMVLHKKLMIGEMDIRNPENGPLGINNRSRNFQATHNDSTFRNFLALYSAYCISWGGGFHAYMMQPQWYNTDKAVNNWIRATRIAAHASGQPLGRDRIAVFVDENSSYCHSTADVPSFHSRLHYRESTQYALWRSGVRCDYYLPQDALHPEFEAPEILLFADAGTLTPEFAARVRRTHGNNGRIIIWVGNAGYLNTGKTETIEQITNFKLKRLFNMNKPLAADGKIIYEPAFYAGSFPSPVWEITDPDAEAMAHYAGTKQVGMAMKKYASHTEIYLGQPGALAPDIVRSLARQRGIRPVQERNDLCVMGGGLLEIGAMTGSGVRRISFPAGVKNLRLLTGQKIVSRGKDFIEIDMPYKDAAVFKMER